MRRLGWLTVGLILVLPVSALAQASEQTIKREDLRPKDLVGTWQGMAVVYDKYMAENKDLPKESPSNPFLFYQTIGLTLWADGTFQLGGGVNGHGSGRWRLNGDTLWFGNDWRYGNDAVNMREGLPQAEAAALDTLQMPAFPKNDSLFWTHTDEERKKLSEEMGGQGYWLLTVYRIAVRDGQLLLARLDGLSNNIVWPASVMMEYRPDILVP